MIRRVLRKLKKISYKNITQFRSLLSKVYNKFFRRYSQLYFIRWRLRLKNFFTPAPQKMDVKFSVLVPVYNNSQYLQECIDSVINQNHKNWQLILSDDCSSDPKTFEILDSINHPQIKVFKQKNNLGISKNTSFLIDQANGDYIAFMDCDDYIRKDALEIINNYISKNNDALFLFTDRTRVDEHSKKLMSEYYGGFYPLLHWNISHEDHKRNLMIGMCTSHLKVVKTEIMKSIAPFDHEIRDVTDYEMALKVTEMGKSVYVPHCLYFWRWHQSQNSNVFSTSVVQQANIARSKALFRRHKRPKTEQLKTTEIFYAYASEKYLNDIEKIARERNVALKTGHISEINEDSVSQHEHYIVSSDMPMGDIYRFWKNHDVPYISLYIPETEGIKDFQHVASHYDEIICESEKDLDYARNISYPGQVLNLTN